MRTWDRVLPALHTAGLRTIVPYLRGYGPTRFRGAAVRRSGQLAALGQDLIDLADGLGLGRFAASAPLPDSYVYGIVILYT